MDKLINLLIKTGGIKGAAGALGRSVGRNFGCAVRGGIRIIIDKPQEYIQSQLLNYGEFEPGISAALRRVLMPGDFALDVGANMGYISLVCARHGAQVCAFEPVPRLAQRIRANAALNHFSAKIQIAEVALSHQNGSAAFYVAERKDDGSHSMIAGVPAKAIHQITVQTQRLDDFLRVHSLPKPDLIKIDVEGYEARVLDGAAETIRQCLPIFIIESGDRLADQLGESAASVLKRFFALGYLVYKIQLPPRPLMPVTLNNISGDLQDYFAIHPSSQRMALLDEILATQEP